MGLCCQLRGPSETALWQMAVSGAVPRVGRRVLPGAVRLDCCAFCGRVAVPMVDLDGANEVGLCKLLSRISAGEAVLARVSRARF